ncbi:uncharacterized protein STEHIDRAFT_163278 [Stereum hirsutum FP-91666 SS1]|uniref:Uncharacterized protein n=1 Tax=Stereum hirsutum (strain FP-91666) TaxID=721885 RepID=R7S0F8_STEHR|nr:uncharacterized protein STEHIDRAFT_163278 [Stereum hirsutum FP-91666 SS1]EIM80027.1 hypothetical protein STEHIDRAFT_163278 [Stereum hirsutum FP-91666 SS1]
MISTVSTILALQVSSGFKPPSIRFTLCAETPALPSSPSHSRLLYPLYQRIQPPPPQHHASLTHASLTTDALLTYTMRADSPPMCIRAF